MDKTKFYLADDDRRRVDINGETKLICLLLIKKVQIYR